MPSARLPCSVIFSQIAGQHGRDVVDLRTLIVGQRSKARRGSFPQFAQQVHRQSGEVVDEVQRVLDLVRYAGGQLAERCHLLGLDQVGLGGFQLAIRAGFGRVARGADLRLAALALGDVGEDQHEAAVRHRVATDLDHPAIRSRALIAVGLAGVWHQLINLLRRIDTRAEVAARCEEAEVFLIGAMLFEQGVWQIEDLLELAVPCHQAMGFVEHRHAVAHVLERDAKFFLALAYFVQQARVLHRDHRLGGEVFQQRDLLVGERTHFQTIDRDVAE